MAGWPIEFSRSFGCSACWKVIACICAHVHAYTMSFTCIVLEHMCLCFLQHSLLISSVPRRLLCFSYFFPFFFFAAAERAVGCHSSLGSDWPQPTARMPALPGWALQHHTGEPWELCSLWVELQLWADEQRIVKQPPPLLSACYTTVCCLLPKSHRGNIARNMDF